MATALAIDPSVTFSAINTANAAAAAGSGASSTQTANEAGSADRFLKLLVSQMQNQDPLNPMDNAQVTSQMAQINTVSGIDKLNATVQGLNAQFLQMQAVTGATLVGHDVTVNGNRLQIENGVGVGGFELGGTASNVKVEVLNGAGRVLDTLNLGALPSGRHAFEWDAAALGVGDGAENRFRVSASNGAVAVTATPLMRDRVNAVSSNGTQLLIDTEYSGSVPYGDVKAFN